MKDRGEAEYFDIRQMRKRLVKIYAIALAVGVPYLVFVLLTGLRFPCVFHELSGLLCPGCGATRMFVSLARLRFLEAYSYNRAFFILLILWNVVALFAFIGKPRLFRSKRFLFLLLVAMTIFLSIFGILRNIY